MSGGCSRPVGGGPDNAEKIENRHNQIEGHVPTQDLLSKKRPRCVCPAHTRHGDTRIRFPFKKSNTKMLTCSICFTKSKNIGRFVSLHQNTSMEIGHNFKFTQENSGNKPTNNVFRNRTREASDDGIASPPEHPRFLSLLEPRWQAVPVRCLFVL